MRCVAEVDIPWNEYIMFKNWEKVYSMDYQVRMNDRHDPILITIKIRFDDPHGIVIGN